MFTRPDELADSDVADALASGWGLTATEVEYAAVGFGSHHWRAVAEGNRWFVTIDDLETCRRSETETNDDAMLRLAAALGVARSLEDSGLSFVVAPVPTLGGSVLQPVDGRFVASLFPHVDGETHSWGAYPTREDRLAVLELVVQLHRAAAVANARVDDCAIPGRDALGPLLADDGIEWGPGPYAEAACALLTRHRDALGRVLDHYDALVVDVMGRPQRWVQTHGEPHRGNTITTVDGVVLIDWDTALIAPPERDLWSLIGEDPSIAAEYSSRTGVDIDNAALEMYRLWWDLCEVSIYSGQLRARHGDTADMRVAWEGLQTYLDPTRWHV